MPLNPLDTYVHFDGDGVATPLPGGEAFWSLPEADMDRFVRGWVVLELEFHSDWANWEMHPNGDEFVYLLSGSLDLLLEQPGCIQTMPIHSGGAFLIPRGIWHTAKVHAPSRMLHITLGAGTQSRPV
ncbi:MAG: cupin domain-containing protein [Acidobacteria bacterium]|nr:cupin domain-containing protein [Acidobacteriota bacterium]